MTKIIYIPLDERGCNYLYPQKLAGLTTDTQLACPPRALMGSKKTPADVEGLWKWAFENAGGCDYAIFSVDTLVYGNIINSRIHQKTIGECEGLLDNFRRLKDMFPSLKIHAFNLAARVAAYNNSQEDPDYWEDHGYNIWRTTFLRDKLSRGHGAEGEKQELEQLEQTVPKEHMDDFIKRRKVNRFVNLACVDLAADGVFDVLTVPKDDTAEYGYAAMDQAAISARVREKRAADRVLVYPGADEVGSIIFARVFCLEHSYVPRVYTRYSSVLGPQIVPKYEDRPLHESIKAQITSVGGVLEDDAARADCMLAINSPGKFMIESLDQYNKDISFQSHINKNEFLRYIKYFIDTFNRPVGLAEVSVCNGCENEFMEFLNLTGTDRIICTAGGWNTAQNTIGVVLAHIVIAAYYNGFENMPKQKHASDEFKYACITADWLFQSNVLHKFLKEETSVDPFKLGDNYEFTRKYVADGVNALLKEYYPQGKGQVPVLKDVTFEWDGIYFASLDVELEE